MGVYLTEGQKWEEALGYILGKILNGIFEFFEWLFGVHLTGGERLLVLLGIIGLFVIYGYWKNRRD